MKRTYISLFSSAGVGCYGFKMEGFECIATNELIERRLNVQKFNNKCKYKTGYICGDITLEKTKEVLLAQIDLWKKKENIKNVDVIVATPPCQGMSVANHKKTADEIIRNSLVVESIKIIELIKPNFFIFENVPSFMNTICTDTDGINKKISETIKLHLSTHYDIISRVLNFKNYGSNSSRTRTVVIGVNKVFNGSISPIDLYPNWRKEKTLRQVIGDLPSLNNFYESDPKDIYHFFRGYSPKYKAWIEELNEGESAFDNKDILRRPHQIIDGKIKFNVNKNGDKYTRQYWDKVGPCIHTRNDQLASQNTIHPKDDRVFSIRELMLMMSVPSSFKWVDEDIDVLNRYNDEERYKFYKREEIKIRQSLGEAVPTEIFRQIAKNIKVFLEYKDLNYKEIERVIIENDLENPNKLIDFIKKNKTLTNNSLMKIAELANSKRLENAAYYTDRILINSIYDKLPDINKTIINVLEPSVGIGNFIPFVLKKYESAEVINVDVVDINPISLEIFEALIKHYNYAPKVNFRKINIDFMKYIPDRRYDLVIGNPPFLKGNLDKKNFCMFGEFDSDSNNLCSYFVEKCTNISNYVVMIQPKYILNTEEFKSFRELINKYKLDVIIDFGEKGFKGVLVETICLFINTIEKPGSTNVISITFNKNILQKQKYITNKELPYWIIYRDDFFDKFYSSLHLGIFKTFRDRQITNKILSTSKTNSSIRVIKSRNINDDGSKIIDIPNYDSYIEKDEAKKLTVYRYLNDSSVYLTPNMTYKSRIIKKPNNCLVNGSVAILKNISNFDFSKEDEKYISTSEYREFLNIARNLQTRTLNIDNNTVYFFGKRKDEDANDK